MNAWDSVIRFETTPLRSQRQQSARRHRHRRIIALQTAGVGSRSVARTYAHDGRSGDIDLLLWPVNFSLAYVGYEVLTPFVAYGVEAGLRYSDPTVVEQLLHKIVSPFCTEMPLVRERASCLAGRSCDWRRGAARQACRGRRDDETPGPAAQVARTIAEARPRQVLE